MATKLAKTPRSAPVMPASKPRESDPPTEVVPEPKPTFAQDIRLNAYLRWEAAGRPPGNGVRFWLEAEKELLQGGLACARGAGPGSR